MKKLLTITLFCLVLWYIGNGTEIEVISSIDQNNSVVVSANDSIPSIETTPLPAPEFNQSQSGSQVEGSGRISRVLTDDNNGSRHQRFILLLPSGQTLLIAHNIDIAPRINDIAINDIVEFNGEYEWNSQGGVVHWTHLDPRGQHMAGYLRHKDRTYQ